MENNEKRSDKAATKYSFNGGDFFSHRTWLATRINLKHKIDFAVVNLNL